MTDNQETPHKRWSGPIEIDYWNVDQRHYEDKLAFLRDHSEEELVTAIVSYHYNAFCRDHADAKDNEKGEQDTRKKISYIGWFWRTIDLCGYVPIGIMQQCEEGPSLIGFMVNNKWDYPERYLTDEERLRVISYLDRAIACTRGSHIEKEAILKELWDYMQTLTIP